MYFGKNLVFFFETLLKCLSLLNASRKSQSKILLCGSSHAYSSFMPQMASGIHSVTFASQDLYAAEELLKFYHKVHKIEHFVIFLSVFSSGFQLQKSKEYSRIYALRFALRINTLSRTIVFILLQICYNIIKIIHKNLITRYRISRHMYYKKNSVQNPESRISRHIHYGKMRDSMVYLNNIINHCEAQKIRLSFVLSPASRSYREQCEKHITPFGYLDELSLFSTDIEIIDLFNTDRFDRGDWEDSDHLHVGGTTAAQVTREILERINRQIII